MYGLGGYAHGGEEVEGAREAAAARHTTALEGANVAYNSWNIIHFVVHLIPRAVQGQQENLVQVGCFSHKPVKHLPSSEFDKELGTRLKLRI